MRTLRVVLTAVVLVELLGACVGGNSARPASGPPPPSAQQRALEQYRNYAGPPIPYFVWLGRLYSWEPLGKDRLVVFTPPTRRICSRCGRRATSASAVSASDSLPGPTRSMRVPIPSSPAACAAPSMRSARSTTRACSRTCTAHRRPSAARTRPHRRSQRHRLTRLPRRMRAAVSPAAEGQSAAHAPAGAHDCDRRHPPRPAGGLRSGAAAQRAAGPEPLRCLCRAADRSVHLAGSLLQLGGARQGPAGGVHHAERCLSHQGLADMRSALGDQRHRGHVHGRHRECPRGCHQDRFSADRADDLPDRGDPQDRLPAHARGPARAEACAAGRGAAASA